MPINYIEFLYQNKDGIKNVEKREVLIADIINYLIDITRECYPRYNDLAEKLYASIEDVLEKAPNEQLAAINQLVAMLSANAARGLKAFGLSESAGRMGGINIGANINDIEFIDTSVTGMFENRRRFEL
jgi:hypothetical protein